MDRLARLVATFFGSGYFPVAPATFASAIVAGILYLLGSGNGSVSGFPGRGHPLHEGLIIVALFPISVWSAHVAERTLGHDASPIVIDEVLGQMITLWFVPRSWPWVLGGFLLFRLFDISSDPPALPPDSARGSALAIQAAGNPQMLRLALPIDPQIRRLRGAIETYKRMELSGGWPLVADGAALTLGDRGPRVVALRERLRASGDVEETAGDPTLFDDTLAIGLRRVQERHGLKVDGIAAQETLGALNVPLSARLATLTDNLQRLARQQRAWGVRYIAVNIAAASVTLVEDGHVAAQRRAIVGRPNWRTPQWDGVIDRLEFHPYWVVPANIARLEVLPKIRKDPNYFRRNNMRIVDGQIRQAPGPRNPLGKVKFIFTNPYSVYLHDTNAPDLFERPERFLSHGCIRVEQALDLARRLLMGDADWPEARIVAVLDAGKNVRLDLKRPIALHLVYDTAWVDDAGVVNFRRDAYGLDRLVSAEGGTRPTENRCGT